MTANDERGGAFPPSAARLLAAARAGRFPRSRLLVAGLSLAAGAGAIALFGAALAERLADLVRGGIAAGGRVDPTAEAAAAAALAAGGALLLLVPPAAISLALALATALRARRGRGSTSTPLPPEHPREHAPLAPRFAALGLMLPLFAWVLGRHRDLPAAWMAGDAGAAAGVARMALELLAAAGLACALAGLVELALIRARLWSALSLTRSQASRELGPRRRPRDRHGAAAEPGPGRS